MSTWQPIGCRYLSRQLIKTIKERKLRVGSSHGNMPRHLLSRLDRCLLTIMAVAFIL